MRSGKIKCGAKALALCVGAKANVPLRVGNKILKKCVFCGKGFTQKYGFVNGVTI